MTARRAGGRGRGRAGQTGKAPVRSCARGERAGRCRFGRFGVRARGAPVPAYAETFSNSDGGNRDGGDRGGGEWSDRPCARCGATRQREASKLAGTHQRTSPPLSSASEAASCSRRRLMERLVVVEPSQHVDGVFVVYPDRERVRDCRGATGGRGASPRKTRGANGARDETRRTKARKQARRSGSEPALAGVPAARGVSIGSTFHVRGAPE
jgi:hypothetical protein